MARTSAALLVDSDLKGLESLVYGFQGVDWRSTACPAPETAGFLIKASAADIVVVASREPHEKTLALLEQLRADPETGSLPLLVIAPANLHEIMCLERSIDFLPTPVFVRDVITASRILVSLGTGPEPKLDGMLAEFGLFSILRSMTSLMRSGVLQAERAGRRGEIFFSEGDVTGAQVGSLQGSAAIHHLLLWEDAKIELHLRPVARRSSINRRSDEIIDEAERFVRDYNHAIQNIGPSSAIYDKNESELAGASGSLPAEIMPVIRLFDGTRTLADIIDQSPFRVFDTVRILTRLVELGTLCRRKPSNATVPVPPLQKFWETACIANPDEASAATSVRKSAPMPAVGLDSRIGDPNRRISQRRLRAETPVMGTPLANRSTTNFPKENAASPAPAAAVPPSPSAPVAASSARTSGTIDLRRTADRRQNNPDRQNRPSVSIDVALMGAAPEPAPAVQPAPPASSGRITGTLQVAPSGAQRRSATHARVADGGLSVAIDPALAKEAERAQRGDSSSASPADPLATKGISSAKETKGRATPPQGSRPLLAPAPAPVSPVSKAASGPISAPTSEGPRTSRATGTLSIASSSRTTASRMADKGLSVQLDPVLVAELDRLEKATTPIGPPESNLLAESQSAATLTPPDPAAPIAEMPTAASSKSHSQEAPASTKSGSARVTGTLLVSPSSRTSAHAIKVPGKDLSFSLDPALADEVQKLAAPKPQAAATPKHGEAPSGSKTGPQPLSPEKGQSQEAAATGRPGHQSPNEGEPQPAGKSGSRISGAFNAIESDFFAREADLYKSESADNFSDLDEPAGRRGTGGSNGRRQSKR